MEIWLVSNYYKNKRCKIFSKRLFTKVIQMLPKSLAKKIVIPGLTSKVHQSALGFMPIYRVKRGSIEGEDSCSGRGLTFPLRILTCISAATSSIYDAIKRGFVTPTATTYSFTKPCYDPRSMPSPALANPNSELSELSGIKLSGIKARRPALHSRSRSHFNYKGTK